MKQQMYLHRNNSRTPGCKELHKVEDSGNKEEGGKKKDVEVDSSIDLSRC